MTTSSSLPSSHISYVSQRVGDTYHRRPDLFALLQTYFPPFGTIDLVALHSLSAMADIAVCLLV